MGAATDEVEDVVDGAGCVDPPLECVENDPLPGAERRNSPGEGGVGTGDAEDAEGVGWAFPTPFGPCAAGT